jgi:hypothetical protein
MQGVSVSKMQTSQHATENSIPGQLEAQGFAIVPDVLPPSLVGEITDQIELAISKSSKDAPHAMRHLAQMVPAVQQAAERNEVRSLVEAVIGPKAFLVRSLYFDKTPDANWKVAWHQDLTIAVGKIKHLIFAGR